MTRKMILLEMLDQMLRFLRSFFAAMQRQIAIVLAIATYENNRKSTGTSLFLGSDRDSAADHVVLHCDARRV